jgi:excisionase family DNA binding protein
MMGDTIPRLIPLAAVAEALAVSPHTIRAWVRKGRLRPVRLCRRLLFSPADIERLVAESITAQVR